MNQFGNICNNTQHPNDETDIELGNGTEINETTMARDHFATRRGKYDRLLKSFLFLFGSCIVTYYSVILLSMFGDLALKSGTELYPPERGTITPLSFKEHQEKAYTDYMAKREVSLIVHHAQNLNNLTFPSHEFAFNFRFCSDLFFRIIPRNANWE